VAVEEAGVVDADLLDLAGEVVLALLDEGFGHRADVLNAAVEPHGGVDAVGEEVACDAGAGDLGVEAPEAGAALREVGVDGPVLEEVRAVVEHAAELAGIDELLGEHDGGAAAVVIPDHVGHLRLVDGREHFLGFLGVQAEGFLAEDHLAGLGGGDGLLGVHVVGRGDVDDVDVVALKELAPVGLDGLVTPLVGEGLHRCGVATADGLRDKLVAGGEEVVDLVKGVAVARPMKL